MWTRAELKTNAKQVLKTNYVPGIIAYALFALVGIVASIFRIIPGVVGMLFFICIEIFAGIPLLVGIYYYFMRLRLNVGSAQINDVRFPIEDNRYGPILGSMCWMVLFTFLWSLLIVVPGIIKGISYSMTPFILTDNPKIGYKRALKLSMAMTKGQLWNIFVLSLSFILWGLLASVPAFLFIFTHSRFLVSVFGFIGWAFLAPYITATFCELYAKLRDNALNSGICTYEELNFVDQSKL